MPEKIFEVAAWGKYIYRSDIERHNFEEKVRNEEITQHLVWTFLSSKLTHCRSTRYIDD